MNIFRKVFLCLHYRQLLTKEQQKSHKNTKISYIYKEKFENKYAKDKKYCKVRGHCHYTGEYKDGTQSISDFAKSVTKKKPIAFHNGSNYDLHFVIKKLAEEFEKQFICLGENIEKIHNLYSFNRKRSYKK